MHRFFHSRGFFHVHTPILTSTDAEGAGEMFGVEGGKDNFFGRRAYLTVSGQLEAELLAMGLSRVYTFGPCFRAENSNTTRHLAEFWMIEPEMAFYDLSACISLAEEMLHSLSRAIEAEVAEELEGLEVLRKRSEKEGLTLPERLSYMQKKFVRMSYDEAVACLERAKHLEVPFGGWGEDLQASHERYLVQEAQAPVVVMNYPAKIKAFYMRMNDGESKARQTVAGMDILFPHIGELVGGSQREERYSVLKGRVEAAGISASSMEWYLDTRRFGSVLHSGFGLGFERLMQFITGMENIRDVIPFHRCVGSISY